MAVLVVDVPLCRLLSSPHFWVSQLKWKTFATHLKRNDRNFFFPLPVHKKQATNYHSQLSPVLTAIGCETLQQSADLCYQIMFRGVSERERKTRVGEKAARCELKNESWHAMH